MFERFTDRSRLVMSLANKEAHRFNHEYIGTEHILLGLLKEKSGVGANVLKNLDINFDSVRKEVEKIIKPGPDMECFGKLPQTPRAKKVIEFAINSAKELNHKYVGTEHLLLGILKEQDGLAAQILMNFGLKVELVESEIKNLLGLAKPEIAVTLPIPDISTKIKELTDKKDQAVKDAEYDEASRLRYEIDQLNRVLDAETRKCDKCVNKASICMKNILPDNTVSYLCIGCAKGCMPNLSTFEINQDPENTVKWTFTDDGIISELTPKQVEKLSPAQPLLAALSKVESGLFDTLVCLSDTDSIERNEAHLIADTIIETANFIKEFAKFRDKLLS